ncbi:MAG TPA: SDR family NAD(P)-dependent oxidoreductase [Candidatus Dormibacteraeota bacterium]|nr:SDR family NAD(P)-dependent oxidoreductase [Candidatus Dormibacteraeota bacterium]
MTSDLAGRVAIVTGASRGIGRGIAIGLGEAGATVYVTGRTAGNLASTAQDVTAAGGKGIAVVCDHRDDRQVADVFARIASESKRLDILVNNATGVPPFDLLFTKTPFWELPTGAWSELIDVGLRSHFVAAQSAARMMIEPRIGLIVNISSSGAKRRFAILPYGVGKAAVDRMTADMAEDLEPFGVTVVSYWPPPTATERMVEGAGPGDDPSAWSLPEFNGRVIARLATLADLHRRSGSVLVARELAAELGVEDPRGA